MTPLARDAIRYAGVSAVSLCTDVVLLATLVQFAHWDSLHAATVSFLVGACVAYVLSVRFVFRTHRLRDRRAEFLGFIALGAIGVAVNAAVIYVALDYFGLRLPLAKGIAAGFSFSCNFFARRQILFVQRQST